VGGPWLEVKLPAGTQVTLTLRLRTGARLPSLRTPWSWRRPRFSGWRS